MDDWKKLIGTFWTDHKGMSHEQAMMQYLKVAETLEMFGVNVSISVDLSC